MLSSAGEIIFEEWRAALVGYHSQTAFQRAQFLRFMSAWTAQDFWSQLKILAAAGGFWEVEYSANGRCMSSIVLGRRPFYIVL